MRDWFRAFTSTGGIRFTPQTWEGLVAFLALLLVFALMVVGFQLLSRP